MTNRFLIAHLFFLIAFLALVCAAVAVVIRRRRFAMYFVIRTM